MSVDAEHPSVAFPPRAARGWLILEGILLVVIGALAAALPVFAGLAVALVVGWMLVLSGFLQLIGLFGARGHDHPVWRAVSALIAIVAGGLVLWSPLGGALGLAILLAAYLLLNGIASLGMAIHHRGRAARGWGWLVLTGIVDIALAIFIAFLRPAADAALLGFFVAINLVIAGVALLGLSAAIRRPNQPAPT